MRPHTVERSHRNPNSTLYTRRVQYTPADPRPIRDIVQRMEHCAHCALVVARSRGGRVCVSVCRVVWIAVTVCRGPWRVRAVRRIPDLAGRRSAVPVRGRRGAVPRETRSRPRTGRDQCDTFFQVSTSHCIPVFRSAVPTSRSRARWPLGVSGLRRAARRFLHSVRH